MTGLTEGARRAGARRRGLTRILVGLTAFGLVAGTSLAPSAVAAGSRTTAVADMGAQVGLARVTNDNYGTSMVFDYNRDGVDDVLLSNHLNSPFELFRGNNDGTFSLTQELPTADRHFCASGDFNSDGRPDFYCTIGADKGTATDKANELWLQDASGQFSSVPGAWGAADAGGRGRDVTVADFTKDGLPDLFVGNGYPTGHPRPNRLFVNTGHDSFVDASDRLGTAHSGGICVTAADVNGDGFTDVFVCGRPNHLYVSHSAQQFHDTAKADGMTKEAGRGATWGDLNGDGHPDLVTVGATELRVYLNNGSGSFANVYSLPLQAGRNVAVADLDQDGSQDIYVVQGRVNNRGANMPDLLLHNDADGRSFRSVAGLPEASGGGGNAVSVLSHYHGRPALLVTNGADGIFSFMGPRQLLVFS